MQALESIRVFSRFKFFSRLHFGHKWLMHFGCASGFSKLCHVVFGRGFILGCGTYRWSSSLGKHQGCFGHFVLMCSLWTFLSHMDNISSSFFHVSCGVFWQKSYVDMWRHWGSRIMRVFLGPLNKVSSSTTNIFWWYRPSFYRGLCPICFSRELGFGGFVFML
jgi:hypothetical protein